MKHLHVKSLLIILALAAAISLCAVPSAAAVVDGGDCGEKEEYEQCPFHVFALQNYTFFPTW